MKINSPARELKNQLDERFMPNSFNTFFIFLKTISAKDIYSDYAKWLKMRFDYNVENLITCPQKEKPRVTSSGYFDVLCANKGLIEYDHHITYGRLFSPSLFCSKIFLTSKPLTLSE